ncbi:hypothetical protein ACFL35_09245, partial [Candidatus Riflebacteria bacterium]
MNEDLIGFIIFIIFIVVSSIFGGDKNSDNEVLDAPEQDFSEFLESLEEEAKTKEAPFASPAMPMEKTVSPPLYTPTSQPSRARQKRKEKPYKDHRQPVFLEVKDHARQLD